MAAFPSYAVVSLNNYSETHAPIVARSEMDRGIPKQRVLQSDVMITLGLTLMFLSAADADSFETWFYGTAQAGAAWFDWTDPRTGIVRQARAVANTLGPLTQMSGANGFKYTTRTLQIEYLRAL